MACCEGAQLAHEFADAGSTVLVKFAGAVAKVALQIIQPPVQLRDARRDITCLVRSAGLMGYLELDEREVRLGKYIPQPATPPHRRDFSASYVTHISLKRVNLQRVDSLVQTADRRQYCKHVQLVSRTGPATRSNRKLIADRMLGQRGSTDGATSDPSECS